MTTIASFNLFHRLDGPTQPIWDESYYLTSTARYELRAASFASHPPLGLMLIAAGDHLSGANAGIDWAPIAAGKKVAGEQMPTGFSYWGVRCASALFGVLAAGLMFLLVAELAGSAIAGLALVSPFLFDTALLAQFRAAQLDAFQVCFAVAALLCLVRGNRSGNGWWTAGFGFACGLAAMVRANGILLLAGLLLHVVRAHGGAGRVARAVAMVRPVATAAAGAILAVAATFLVHLAVASHAMPASWAAARADAPYLSPAYAAELATGGPHSATALWQAVDGYRRFMAADVAGVGLADGNASAPWEWPLGRRPIVYRWDSDGRTTAYVALVPNLAAWVLSLLGVVDGVVALAFGKRSGGAPDCPLLLTLLALWATFQLSAVALAQVRVMYLYHYFLPLVIGWVLAAACAPRVVRTVGGARLATPMVGAVLAGFALTAPFALHRPLTDGNCRIRAALSGTPLCQRDTATPRVLPKPDRGS